MSNEQLLEKMYNQSKISKDTLNHLMNGVKSTSSLENGCDEKDAGLRVTVIIPTHNRKERLKRCINSILSQNYSNIEIIVVDDNSSDETHRITEEVNYKDIVYLRNNKSLGAGGSRRKGYEHSTGDIIIFCDDDDYYVDMDYFKKANSRFQANDELVMLCSNSLIMLSEFNKYEARDIRLEDLVSTKNYLNEFGISYDKPNSTFTLALRKKHLDKIEYKNLVLFNDTSIYLYALLAKGQVGYLREYIGVYEIHGNNMSTSMNTEFLLENLNSKKDIYEKAKKEGLLVRPQQWLFNQINITVMYLIYGSKPKIKEITKVANWVLKNMQGKYMIIQWMKIYYAYLKVTLKAKIKS